MKMSWGFDLHIAEIMEEYHFFCAGYAKNYGSAGFQTLPFNYAGKAPI